MDFHCFRIALDSVCVGQSGRCSGMHIGRHAAEARVRAYVTRGLQCALALCQAGSLDRKMGLCSTSPHSVKHM